MKGIFRNKARKAFLTVAISLTLAGNVFAMPVLDHIEPYAHITIPPGGNTIQVKNEGGTVFWKSFNIDKGEALNIIFKADEGELGPLHTPFLMNKVTGADMSKIYGTMTSTGRGLVYLVNPNGILIGDGARINVGNLILRVANEDDPSHFSSTNPSKGIVLESGAQIHFNNLLEMYAGKIEIADNVTLSGDLDRAVSKEEYVNPHLLLRAVNSEDSEFYTDKMETIDGNSVTIGKANITLPTDETAYMGIVAHDITLNGTNISLPADSTKDIRGSLDLLAANSWTRDGETLNLKADVANTIRVNDAHLSAPNMLIDGGNVALKNASLNVVNADASYGYLDLHGANVLAGTDTEIEADGIGGTGYFQVTKKLALTTDKDSLVNITGGNIASTEAIEVVGGSANVDGSAQMKADGTFLIGAFQSMRDFSDSEKFESGTKFEASPANVTTVKDATLMAGGGMNVYGGNVVVSDSTLTNTDKVRGIDIDALKTHEKIIGALTYEERLGKDSDWTMTKDHAVTIANSTLNSANDLLVRGGSVTIEKGTKADAKGLVQIGAATAFHEGLHDNTKIEASPENTIVVKDSNITSGNSADNGLAVYGGKVDIADSELTNTTSGAIDVEALNAYEEVDGNDTTWSATKDNTVTVTNSTLKNQATGGENSSVLIVGGKTALKQATIGAENVEIHAQSKADESEDGNTNTIHATDGMTTNIMDSTINVKKGAVITGKDVTLDGKTAVTTDGTHPAIIAAGSAVELKHAGDTQTVTADGANVQVGKSVTLPENAIVKPGKTVIDGTSDPGTKPSDSGTKPSDSGTKSSGSGTTPSDTGTKPSTPGTKPSASSTETSGTSTKPGSIVTPTPKVDVDIETNIEKGKAAMEATLKDNASNMAHAVAQEAQKLSDADMTEAEKSAQLVGYMKAVLEREDLSADEKQDLQRDIVRNFEGTAAGDSQAQDKQAEASDVDNAALKDLEGQAAPELFDAENVTTQTSEEPTVTKDGEAQD